jgi:hypothetical protein
MLEGAPSILRTRSPAFLNDPCSATHGAAGTRPARGAGKLLSGKLKLGADASAVAGPAGAEATAFNDPNVDVIAYSQAKGLFAGASLGSASMDQDDDMNKELYGKAFTVVQIVREGAVPVPPAAKELLQLLDKMSPKRKPVSPTQ